MHVDSLVVDHQFYGSRIPAHWICHHYSGEFYTFSQHSRNFCLIIWYNGRPVQIVKPLL